MAKRLFLVDMRDPSTKRTVLRALLLYLAGNGLFFSGIAGFTSGFGEKRLLAVLGIAGFWLWWVPFLAGHYLIMSIKIRKRARAFLWSIILFFPATVLAILPVYAAILLSVYAGHFIFR